ncbi:DUF3040 domain-containing protein [Tsukamurella spumae]|uniref:DUF3040 domain-containing protein n=1 Tax=Tsukamurella spumae TaxID=44753 RepID=A0A846X8V7_9ACTN|nr:DUF3040 domain-containing protein [Tsukamurella spumae]NKY20876.1 DUF3040 domain-containing protein [Tsukamurella spumae]
MTEPVEPTEPTTTHPALLGLSIALGLLAGFALIVAGVAWGGWWRVGSAAAAVVGVAVIMLPGYVNDKQHNKNGGEK